MQNKVPLYPYSAKDAMKRGEIEKWRESFRENCACAGGIDILIREKFDGMHLKDGTWLLYTSRICRSWLRFLPRHTDAGRADAG